MRFTCPRFTPDQLRHALVVDAAIRWAVLLAMLTAIVWLGRVEIAESAQTTLYMIMILGGWYAVSSTSMRASQQVAKISSLLDENLSEAERILASAMKRRPLPRAIRLLLYERLAVLRSRQKQFAEVAAICHAVLTQPSHTPWPTSAAGGYRSARRAGPGGFNVIRHGARLDEQTRINLLLMMVEAHLQCQDLGGAYHGLLALHRSQLSLIDLLQLLTLQTRYELETGHTAFTLQYVQPRVRLAELMPPAQCSAIHGMLAIAAQRQRQPQLMRWLAQRAHLLHPRQRFQRQQSTPLDASVYDDPPIPPHATDLYPWKSGPSDP